MATATIYLPEYLSALEAACENEAALENAGRQSLAGRFNRLQDMAVEPGLDATEGRQIAAAMRRIISTHPPKWVAFETSRTIQAIQSAQ